MQYNDIIGLCGEPIHDIWEGIAHWRGCRRQDVIGFSVWICTLALKATTVLTHGVSSDNAKWRAFRQLMVTCDQRWTRRFVLFSWPCLPFSIPHIALLGCRLSAIDDAFAYSLIWQYRISLSHCSCSIAFQIVQNTNPTRTPNEKRR